MSDPHVENKRIYAIDVAVFGEDVAHKYWQAGYRKPNAPPQPSRAWLFAPCLVRWGEFDADGLMIAWWTDEATSYTAETKVVVTPNGRIEQRPPQAWFDLMTSSTWIEGPGGRFEYPKPLEKPPTIDAEYWEPSIIGGSPSANRRTWIGGPIDKDNLAAGQVYLDPDLAIKKAQAMIDVVGHSSRSGYEKEQRDAYVSGFICAGGHIDEAQSQAEKFMDFVRACKRADKE